VHTHSHTHAQVCAQQTSQRNVAIWCSLPLRPCAIYTTLLPSKTILQVRLLCLRYVLRFYLRLDTVRPSLLLMRRKAKHVRQLRAFNSVALSGEHGDILQHHSLELIFSSSTLVLSISVQVWPGLARYSNSEAFQQQVRLQWFLFCLFYRLLGAFCCTYGTDVLVFQVIHYCKNPKLVQKPSHKE
jgi:hypothetical protein